MGAIHQLRFRDMPILNFIIVPDLNLSLTVRAKAGIGVAGMRFIRLLLTTYIILHIY